jgi:hypothetical protein
MWSYHDLWVYGRVRSHTPLGPALWRGEIGPGARIDNVIAKARPNRTLVRGPFTTLYYFPAHPGPDSICLEGMVLHARDGRLVSASSYSCTWERGYFEMSDSDKRDFQAGFDAWIAAARKAETTTSP